MTKQAEHTSAEGRRPLGISKPPGPGAALDRDWPAYFAAVDGLPPRETLLRALALFDGRPREDARAALAVDVGSGSGRDTLEMLRRGWRVIAVDPEADGHARLMRAAPPALRERLTMVIAPLERADLAAFARAASPGGADLVNASFTLPFIPGEVFAQAWACIVDALRPGGVFSGQFFGDRDGWASIPRRSHHTRGAALGLLAPFALELFDEQEKDGKDAFGDPKHFHVFHAVAVKR